MKRALTSFLKYNEFTTNTITSKVTLLTDIMFLFTIFFYLKLFLLLFYISLQTSSTANIQIHSKNPQFPMASSPYKSLNSASLYSPFSSISLKLSLTTTTSSL